MRNLPKQFDKSKGAQRAKLEQIEEPHAMDDDSFQQFNQEVDLIIAARDAWMHSLTSDQPFDTSNPCRVCGETGHAFEDCEPLKNVPFMQKCTINNQMNSAHDQRMTAKALANQSREKTNQLQDKAAATEAEEGEQETVFDDNATEVVDNAEPDFRQRGIQICGVQTHLK